MYDFPGSRSQECVLKEYLNITRLSLTLTPEPTLGICLRIQGFAWKPYPLGREALCILSIMSYGDAQSNIKGRTFKELKY